MPLKVVVGTVEKEADHADIYIGTAKKRVNRIEYYTGSAWKLVQVFASPISLTCVPSSTQKSETTSGESVSITSPSVLASVSGGVGPFTYQWVQLTGSAATINSPTLATTTFTDHSVGVGSEVKTYRCTVTDSLGQTATADVTVTFTNFAGV